MIITPDIWLTQHLGGILSNDDSLYQQIGKCGQLLAWDIPTYMCMYNCQFKVSEKQSAVDYINRCNGEYCMITLADDIEYLTTTSMQIVLGHCMCHYDNG